MMRYYGDYYGYGMGYGWGHFFNVLLVVLIIAFFVFLVVRNRKHGHRICCGGLCSSCGSDKAVELLRERYVKGEIERAEFEQKKKDLTN